VLHQIGAGRLGPVFRAWQTDRDRLVAIKVFQLDLVPEQVTALVAELQKLVAQRLAHGAIAAPIGAGIQGGTAYLAQEFCTGESLDVAMRQGSGWPAPRVLKVLGRIGSAIDIAAARGANHGALHPRDVLLSASDVRVTGFGVLQALERAGLRVLGRHPYGAPELAEGQRSGTPADVYALAVLAYELLAGRRVSGIADQSLDQLAAAQHADPSALRQVFATALATDPRARYRTARAFTTALEGALSGASPRLPGLEVEAEAEADDPETESPALRDHGQEQPMAPEVTIRDADLPLDAERPSVVSFPGAIPPDRTNVMAEGEGFDLPLATDGRPARREAGPTEFDASVLDELPPAAEPVVDLPEQTAAPEVSPQPPAHVDREPEPSQPAVMERAVQRPPLFAEVSPGDEPEEDVAPVSHGIAYTATWPLVLALGVGLLVGFALGYGLGMRDVTVAPIATEQASSASSSANGNASTAIAQPPASAAAATAASGITERDLSGDRSESASAGRAPAADSSAATPARPVLPVDGRLVIRSTPPGARVLLNGRVRGVTPLSLSGLPFATYRLRLELSGYQADERRVALDASSAARTLAETLRPVARPPTGRVVVESRPSGAQVFIDERLVGTTPLTLPAVAAGEHHLRLAQPGFRAWIATVDVTGGEPNRVTASLEEGPPHE
jgi:serine/threonine protein kinase